MYETIEFNQTAFKHGYSDADIRWALETHICDELLEGFDNKYAVIGFDLSGNLMEVMYNIIDGNSINVFHAMKCRDTFRSSWNWRKNMARMTEEEEAALDDLLTRTTPCLTGIPGVFARQKALLEALDSVAANYIRTKAETTHQSPLENRTVFRFSAFRRKPLFYPG
ncbi:MAG: hypothetical protein LBJ41_05220 [Treponema sp.]|nr:hypothetical protein [Treponema sp.]